MLKDDVDLYSMLNSTDILITDYSSIMFDYMHLQKPIMLVTPDENEYFNSRGFLMSPFTRLIDIPKIIDENSLYDSFELHRKNNYTYDHSKNFIHEYIDSNINRNVDWIQTL